MRHAGPNPARFRLQLQPVWASRRRDTYQMDLMVLAEENGTLLGLQLLLLLGLQTLILTDTKLFNM